MKRRAFQIVPFALLAVFVAEVVAVVWPRPEGAFHMQAFGRLPVLCNGRLQPLDTVGRNALLQIRGTTSVPLGEKKSYQFWRHPPKLRATEWLLEVMASQAGADARPIFLIHHPELLDELELRGKGVEKSGLHYFAFNDLTNVLERIERAGSAALGVRAAERTAYQRQAVGLHNAVTLYRRLKYSLQPEGTTDLPARLTAFRKSVAPGLAALRAREAGQPFDQAALDRLAGFLHDFETMSQVAYLLVLPPDDGNDSSAGWRDVGQALIESGLHGSEPPPAVGWLAEMSRAYGRGDAAAFNRALAAYGAWLEEHAAAAARRCRVEFFYNRLQAFLHAMIIYLCAFLLAGGAMLALALWPAGAETLRRSALYLTVLALAVHTAGLLLRMWLERRPPVTNLYSSAVFVGWAAVALGVWLERVHRVGLCLAVSTLVGFVTLVIAHNLALGGDTMEMMRAVLDSNFWLTTHVITITLGYAAMFLAGLLGGVYVLLGVLTPVLSWRPRTAPPAGRQPAVSGGTSGPPLGEALARMVYGVVCFATLFSFVGTVLGGIWADQAWGRFWGWDPKENGALMIVLWCAAMLHARRCGWIRERGLMNMALFGNVVTAFAWFGVNLLGVGLHSYGFMEKGFWWLVLFWASQLALIGLGLTPRERWRSFAAGAPGGAAAQPGSGGSTES